MASQINNYQCPACTGPLHFEGTTGKLQCDYCDSVFSVQEIESLYAEQEAKAKEAYAKEAAEGNGWKNEGSEQWDGSDVSMKSYGCPSCGAELVCDETTAATSCPYCGNPTVIPGQFAESLKPDLIIPFKLNQEAAKKALLQHYKGKKLLPKDFIDGNRVNEITGVYIPFWLFDGSADGDVTYNATKVHTKRVGDEEIEKTDHYKVRRKGKASFEKIPVDGSSKMDDNYMDSIEPYNYSELCDFSTAYLPGFLADKYDEDIEKVAPRADTRIVNTTYNMLRNTVTGYNSVTVASKSAQLKRDGVKYALFPAWMLSTKYNDKVYSFVMNGQTGKMVGDLPISWGKFWAWFFGLLAGCTLLFTILGMLMFDSANLMMSFIVAAVIALITCMVFKGQMKSVHKAITADNYVTKGGLTLSVKEDTFTHSTEVRRKINNNKS